MRTCSIFRAKGDRRRVCPPGTGEAPRCPVYIDGKKDVTLEGTYAELAVAFQALVDNYIQKKYPRKAVEAAPAGR